MASRRSVNDDASVAKGTSVVDKILQLSKYPVVYVLISAAIGISVGVGLSKWAPSDDSKDTLLQWIGLVGDLFVRSLKAIVLPIVFISVSLSVVDMMNVGRASSVGLKTLVLYLTTTFVAAIIAILVLFACNGLFESGTEVQTDAIEVTLGCDKPGTFLSEGPEGTMTCSAMPEGAGSTPEDTPENMKFAFTDLSDALIKEASGPTELSLSDTLYSGVFTKLVTDNLFLSLSEGQFAAVIFFAIFFGCAFAKHIDNNRETSSDCLKGLFAVMKDTEATLVVLIGWLIKATPLAVFSLITKAVGGQDDVGKAFKNVGVLVAVTVLGMIIHAILIHIVLLFLVLRRNPFSYLKYIVPAHAMALACSSSAATLPVTMKSVAESGIVPETIWKFVLPLGATINMDGSAIAFPCACIWLAMQNGINPTAANYILLVIIASIGSAGAAPVPSGGLALIITAYNTVFNATGTPPGFEFVVAIDWLLDRLQTAMNVGGDACVCAMVAKWVERDEEIKNEKKGGGDVEQPSTSTAPSSST